MVEIIGITGGKGGTGKSTIATALASALSKKSKVLLVDADVECPNDHLLLGIEREFLKEINQRIPRFDLDKCTKCGKCGKVCKNNAIVSIEGKAPIFMENQCNGCGACEYVCPSNAIQWGSKSLGKIHKGKKDNIQFLSGELRPNQMLAETIVGALNKEIIQIKERFDFIIIDTAAGAHCPVIEALSYADKVFSVTEPTPLGAHDLDIILSLLKQLKKESNIIINKSDVGDKKIIEELAKEYNRKIILEVPYSKEIIDSYTNEKPIEIPSILNIIKE